MTNNNITGIVVSGVGGQGVLLASNLIGNAAMLSGLDARVTETHGLSQRGGSLISFVRVGREVHAPLIDPGSADYIISMELLEGLRSIVYSGRHTIHIANLSKVLPATVLSGKAKYPLVEEIKAKIASSAQDAFFLDAASLAIQAGKVLYQNVVLVGFFAGISNVAEPKFYQDAIREFVPAKSVEVNLKAFELGLNASQEAKSRLQGL